MKKKNLNAKLSLKKITISRLEAGEMQKFFGGTDNLCNSYANCLPELTKIVVALRYQLQILTHKQH